MELQLDNGKYQVVFKDSNLDVSIAESAPLNVVVGESARIEVGEAINYIQAGTQEIAEAVQEGIASFDSNAQEKTDEFNTDASEKLSEYNSNAAEKLSAYNANDVAKTQAYNSNAQEKLNAYNTNASEKLSEFNTNYTEKKALIDAQVDIAEEQANIATSQAQTATVQASSATASANRASVSETNAKTSELSAYNSEQSASQSAAAAAGSATSASQSASSASSSASSAGSSATASANSATSATNSANLAKQWAIGDPSEPAGNSAKYWAEQSAAELSGLTTRVSTIEGKIPSAASSSNQLADKSYVDTADNGLQQQIDAITAASDVTDIVGTYAQLQAYDTSTLPNNSIIKVLQDESRNDETTYYRWVITAGVGAWSLIGEEGPYYTIASADATFQEKLVSGTNIKTINSNSILGSGNLDINGLPTQTGQSGKFLTTDGTDASWADVDALPSQTGQSGKYLTTDGSSASWATLSVNPDNKSITTNSSDKLQTVGVIDSNNTTNAIKTWTGTKAQYEAIASKDANTLYNTDNGLFLGTTQIANLSSVRNIGEIIQSTIPLSDAGLHLLDGALISGSGAYSAFVTHMADLYSTAAKVSNINIVGTLTDNNGVISGFSTGNYIKNNSSFSLGSNFEIVTKITTGSSFSNYEALFQSMPEYTGVKTYLASGKLAIALSSNGSSYDIGTYTATNALSTSTTYYIKVTYNGNVYNVDISTDGTSYTNVTSFTSSLELAVSSYFRFGIDDNLSYPFNGSIDLNDSYININGSRWWTGRTPECFTDEAQWQQSVTTYGVCGKFVYDSVNNTVRLPKIAGFTEGTIDTTVLGDLVEAGLPDHMHTVSITYGTSDGAFAHVDSATNNSGTKIYDSSYASTYNPIYGNSTTVQPQSIKVLYYIVIANSTKTNIEVDIDEVMTDLNGKADVDLSNVNASGTSLASGWAMPSDRYIDLTLGASGSTYTAPANGWVVLNKIAGSDYYYCSLQVKDTSNNVIMYDFRGVYRTSPCTPKIPVLKGQQFTLNYNATGTTQCFRFVYAEGEPNV